METLMDPLGSVRCVTLGTMDLARPWLLYLKAGLFLVLGTLAGGLLMWDI